MNNSQDNFFQFQSQGSNNEINNQNNNFGDPFGIANNALVFQPGFFDMKTIDKVYKMPGRLLFTLCFLGLLVVVGLILFIISLTNSSDDLLKIFGIVFMALGVLMSPIFIPTIIKNKKMSSSIDREVLRHEFGRPHYYLPAAKTYFTENYVISLFASKIITRYSDIIWVYDEIRNNGAAGGAVGGLAAAINSGLGSTNIVLVLSDKKKYRFPSADQVNSIYYLISSMNNNVITGKNKETKQMFKEYKNMTNNMPQNNNYNNQQMMNNNQNGNDNFYGNMNQMQNNMYNNGSQGNNFQGGNNQ